MLLRTTAVSAVVFFALQFTSTNSAFAAEAGDDVQFTSLPAFRSRNVARWGTTLRDIMEHEAPGDNDQYADRITLAHETTHGINAYLRNHVAPRGRYNAFYVLEDRAVIVEEPGIRKSQIAGFVPPSLRESRYATYVTGQTEWDDSPLYLWDEWTAYANGAAAGVDLVEKHLWGEPWQDGVMGPLEFVVYALATGQAVQKYDPTYFRDNSQFREFLAWNIRRSMTTYYAGAMMDAFKWDRQDAYLNRLRSSGDAQNLRQFARATFGEDWTQKYLGF